MKKSIFILYCIIACLCLWCTGPYTSSTNITPAVVQKDPIPQTIIRTEWDRYGAYYESDMLTIKIPTLQSGESYSDATIKYVIKKRIRILTHYGVMYGTVRISHYNKAWVTSFKPRMFDENGVEKVLNATVMEAEYKKTETVIFPNVTPGCVLETNIVLSAHDPLTAFEYWFSGTIPIGKASFSFSYPRKFEYAFKEYGHCKPAAISHSSDDNITIYTWTSDDVLPLLHDTQKAKADVTEDRVALAMKYGFEQSVYTSWSTLASSLNKYYFQISSFTSPALTKIADSLGKDIESEYERADKVLAWVQDNISLEKLGSDDEFNPATSFQKRQASVWEKAFICNRMLTVVGVTSDLVLTRAHPLGGFDHFFVTPISLQIPLVVANINDTTRCAYPYTRGYALGDYPERFFGLQGVNLTTYGVNSLPAPRTEHSTCDYTFAIDYVNDTLNNNFDIEYTGPFAWKMRSRMLLLQPAEIREEYQQTLSSFEAGNKLTKCTVFNLMDRDKPLRIKLVFYNQNQITQRKGVTYIGLSHLFDSYAEEYDSSKVSPFNFSGAITIKENIAFKKSPKNTTTMNVSCAPLKNPLFSSYCTSSESPEYCKIRRIITMKRNDIWPDQAASYSQDIQALQQIKESSVKIYTR